eukprot:sb/3479146/
MFCGIASTSNIGKSSSASNSYESESCRARISVASWTRPELPPLLLQKTYTHIIVSGQLFTTYDETLKTFPTSLLGNEQLRRQYYNPHRNAFIFVK